MFRKHLADISVTDLNNHFPIPSNPESKVELALGEALQPISEQHFPATLCATC